jgi:hypothetical protein
MIIKVLEASTVHVTPDTMDMIDNARIGVTTMASHYGAFIAVINDPVIQRKIVQEEDLYPLFDMARKEDCEWIYLDRDADTIDGLPTYEEEWG